MKVHLITIFAFTVTLFSVDKSHALFSKGSCATPKLKRNFSRDELLGRWYIQSRDKGFILEKGQCCGTEDYFLRNDGNIQVEFNSYNKFFKWPKLKLSNPLKCNYAAGSCY